MIKRKVKKLVYGVFYFLVFSLIIWLFIGGQQKPVASCFDNILNQGEEEVDCGGPCTPCAVKKLEPIRVFGEVKMLYLSSGRTVLLAEVVNPNDSYGAPKFSYKFLIYDSYNRLAQTIYGTDSIFNSEKKYIYESGVELLFKNITRVELIIEKPDWVGVGELLRPTLALAAYAVDFTGSAPKVVGRIVNQGPLFVRRIKIIAVLNNRFGVPIFASQTIIDDLPPFAEKTFTVSFPADKFLSSEKDALSAKVFLSPQ